MSFTFPTPTPTPIQTPTAPNPTVPSPAVPALAFDAPVDALLDALALHAEDVPFGVIGLDERCRVRLYNRREAQAAGLAPERVLGAHLFQQVAPCMNNFMVGQKFEDQVDLDETLPYMLTLRMRPTRVRLRLIARCARDARWLLVDWSA